jgi:hypothetical protein
MKGKIMNMIFVKTADFNEMYEDIFGATFESNCTNLSKCMRVLGWKWADAEFLYPTPEEVKKAIIELYEYLINDFMNAPIQRLAFWKGQYEIATGGLHMTLYYDLEKREITGIDLKFNIWEHEAN